MGARRRRRRSMWTHEFIGGVPRMGGLGRTSRLPLRVNPHPPRVALVVMAVVVVEDKEEI